MRYFIFGILCWVSSSCCAQSAGLAKNPYAAKYILLDSIRGIMNNIPYPEAGRKLEAFENWATNEGDRELAGEFRLLAIRRKMIEFSHDDTIEQKLRQLITSSEENGYEYLETDAIQSLGLYYWDNDQKQSLALENFVAAYNIYSKFSGSEFPPKQSYLYDLGGSYFRYEDYVNAIRYLKEAISIKPGSTKSGNFNNPINNTIGLCYQRLDRLDSAIWYFQNIYELSRKINDTAWTGIAAGNIGNVYFLQKKYKEAIPMLETDVNNSLNTNQLKSAAGSMYKLSVIYYLQHDLDKSQQLLLDALDLCEHKNFWPTYSLAERFYSQLSKVYAAKGNMRFAYLYADSALDAKDSLVAEHNRLNIARSQEKIDYMQHKLETGKLLNAQRIMELVRNCLIVAILMMCVIGILFVNRQRLQQKKLEAEKKNAVSELEIASIQLENIKQSVQEKNQLIEHFTHELERQKTGEEVKSNDELLTQLERATILTDEQWENFRDVFEKVHKGFFTSLKKKIPDLTPAEIRFLALTKLKMTSKEMASMLGISTNAIRIYRHRLRKKLDLDKDDMIEALVESI